MKVTTEQEWLGNDRPAPADPAAARRSREAAGEAALLAGMKRALKPFPPAAVYPRAGVRLRPDGSYQVRIWLDPTLPDPTYVGKVDTVAEACNLGTMFARILGRA